MITDYYKELGELVLASRLRKVSERLLTEISEVYKTKAIDFEPGWFHILYLLHQKHEMSIMQIAEVLQMAHPSVIQVSKVMQKNEVIKAYPGKDDKRKRMLALTTKGEDLIEKLIPEWEQIQKAVQQVLNEGEYSKVLFKALDELEENLNSKSLAKRCQ